MDSSTHTVSRVYGVRAHRHHCLHVRLVGWLVCAIRVNNTHHMHVPGCLLPLMSPPRKRCKRSPPTDCEESAPHVKADRYEQACFSSSPPTARHLPSHGSSPSSLSGLMGWSVVDGDGDDDVHLPGLEAKSCSPSGAHELHQTVSAATVASLSGLLSPAKSPVEYCGFVAHRQCAPVCLAPCALAGAPKRCSVTREAGSAPNGLESSASHMDVVLVAQKKLPDGPSSGQELPLHPQDKAARCSVAMPLLGVGRHRVDPARACQILADEVVRFLSLHQLSSFL